MKTIKEKLQLRLLCSFYKENNFKPCLTKQLLNMFKLWCEQGMLHSSQRGIGIYQHFCQLAMAFPVVRVCVTVVGLVQSSFLCLCFRVSGYCCNLCVCRYMWSEFYCAQWLGHLDQFLECFSVFSHPPLPIIMTLLLLSLLLLLLVITVIFACVVRCGRSFTVLSGWSILISFWSVLVFSTTLLSL